MVVDDDSNICELLRLYLEKEDFDVCLAYNGKQALELFEKQKPDLILLDIMMPELDGWQVCREIRKSSACPIIMLTAKGEVFDKVLGLELGADDYVVKPFEAKEVVARVKAVLRRSGKGRQKSRQVTFDKLHKDIKINTSCRVTEKNRHSPKENGAYYFISPAYPTAFNARTSS